MVVVQLRQQDEHDRDVLQAYTMAVLMRSSKLPDVETLLSSGITARRQPSVETHRAALSMLSERTGIPLRKGMIGRVIRRVS